MGCSCRTRELPSDTMSPAVNVHNKIAQLENEIIIAKAESATVWKVADKILRIVAGLSDSPAPSSRQNDSECELLAQSTGIGTCLHEENVWQTRNSAVQASECRFNDLLSQFDRHAEKDQKKDKMKSAETGTDHATPPLKAGALYLQAHAPSLLDIESTDMINDGRSTTAPVLTPKRIDEETSKINIHPQGSGYIARFVSTNKAKTTALQRGRVRYTDIDSQPHGPSKAELEY